MSGDHLHAERPADARLFWALVVALPILLHCFVFEAGVGGADGWSYFANVESLVLDRDLDLTNNRLPFPPNYPADPYMWIEETGRWVTHEPLGAALLDAPAYALGRLVTRFWRPRIHLDRLPYSRLDSRVIALVFFISLAHNAYVAAAMLVVFAMLLKMGARPSAAAGAALLTFFGGPLHYYACNGLSHAPAAFVMALLVYAAARVALQSAETGARPGALLLFGALIGFISVTRYVDGVVAVPAGLCVFAFRLSRERAAGRPLAAAFGRALLDPILVALGCWSTAWITLVYWKTQFGCFTGNPHASGRQFAISLWPPPLAKILFSPRHGFFPFSPVFLLGALGLAALIANRPAPGDPVRARAQTRLAWIAAGSFLAVALVYDSYEEWFAAGTYSTRFLSECVVLLSLGLWRFLAVPGARWRWAAAWLAAAYSYALFLLTRGRLIDQVDAFDVGRSLGAYAYVFRERVPLSAIAAAVWKSSFTMRFLAQRPALLAAFLLACAAGGAALWLLRPRRAETS